MRRAAAMATGLGLGGCLVVNGAFEPAGGDGSTSSSGASTGPDCLGEGGACVSQQIAGETYLICEESGTWEQARAACEARCARLAILDEVESAELVAALRAQMTDEDIKQEQDGGDQTVWPRAAAGRRSRRGTAA